MNSSWDRFFRYLTFALCLHCLLQIALWLPGYLTRPWFADHDVFATMAQSWDSGIMPYRDLIANNFPGTIYIFYGLGKAFGWGRVPALYAADAALLLLLGAMILGWSRARFGRILPGLIGFVAITTYYFPLDLGQTAQRDWHAPCLVLLGIMAAQVWPARGGRWVAAVTFALAMLIRPQVILILPAVLLAITEKRRLDGEPWTRTIGSVAAWLGVVGLIIFLGFLPLIRDGLMGDFVAGIRLVAYGGKYNTKTIKVIVRMFAGEVFTFKILAVVVSAIFLAGKSGDRTIRSTVTTWLVALAGVSLYAPLSPGYMDYLFHPIHLLWSMNLAVLAGLVLRSEITPEGICLSLLLALGLAGPVPPNYCEGNINRDIREPIAALREGRFVRQTPSGYFPAMPRWEDYSALLAYLREKTAPETRVADLLTGVAINSPAGRLSAIPAESATWLHVVKSVDEAKFAKALEDAPDAVVVWTPEEFAKQEPPLPLLEEAVRKFYVPDVKFGVLEVWKRRPKG